jgi:hypothetical protein
MSKEPNEERIALTEAIVTTGERAQTGFAGWSSTPGEASIERTPLTNGQFS